MNLIWLILYLIPLTIIFAYCLMQLSLIIQHFKYKERLKSFATKAFDQSPFVTVQLPVYNELYVCERLIDSIVKLNYPKEFLEIQVLDDSTDETTQILEKKIREYQNKGYDIQLIRRASREGFKAGALQYGMDRCKGEFIAIFDADFIPEPDFLQNTLPYFLNDKVGVIQSRWGHINEDYSLLTQLQAFGLDAHFFIEQTGRSSGQHFINFNGTGGIWRKKTIYDAGGWSPDTLTEDLDLSYRAQLKGWQFIYLKDLVSPAELPVSMPAIKSQQYRWMKGGAECFRKNAMKVLKSGNMKFSSKIQGIYHLLNSSIFLAVVALAIFSVPLVFNPFIFSKYHRIVNLTTIFQINWLILGSFYWLAFRQKSKSFLLFTIRFFEFLVFMMGLSLHNSIAVIEGLIGRKTPFVRTPKFNLMSKGETWKTNKYAFSKVGLFTWLELLIGAFFAAMLFVDFQRAYYGMLPFHFMVSLGYFLVSIQTIKHSKSSI